MSSFVTHEGASNKKMWLSKLGNSYDMATIERNDAQTKRELDSLRGLPENRFCADCGNGHTVWASVNLGVFLCIRCGSHHRGIGTHISKPKGCTGTYLWGPDEIERMRSMGNARAAVVYGGDTSECRPDATASDVVWRQFLVDKYERKSFAPQLGMQVAAAEALTTTSSAPTHDFISFEGDDVLKVQAKTAAPNKSTENVSNHDFFEHFGL